MHKFCRQGARTVCREGARIVGTELAQPPHPHQQDRPLDHREPGKMGRRPWMVSGMSRVCPTPLMTYEIECAV